MAWRHFHGFWLPPSGMGDCSECCCRSIRCLETKRLHLPAGKIRRLYYCDRSVSARNASTCLAVACSATPGHHHQGVAGDVEIGVLQVVDARPAHLNAFAAHGSPGCNLLPKLIPHHSADLMECWLRLPGGLLFSGRAFGLDTHVRGAYIVN